MPALWASSVGEGAKGGIEPAEVLVRRDSKEGGFSIDLTTITANGAGPAWRAATGAAAAAAMMMSGLDPDTVDMAFTITGPIDGPSAGGILTVGLLAALRQTPLLPGVTMTGTISPDGSIGPVGFVSTKLRSARDAGYRTVIIPASVTRGDDGQGNSVDIVDYGSSLGLTIVPVTSIEEAYLRFTGQELFAPVRVPVEPSPSTGAAIEQAARSMQASLSARLDTAPGGTDPDALVLATRAVAQMDGLIAGEDWAAAYGIGAFAFLQLSRAIGGATMQARIGEVGVDAAESDLAAAISAALMRARGVLDTSVRRDDNRLEQQLCLPAAASWVAYAIATYEGLLAELGQANDTVALLRAAQILAEEQAGVDTMFPDAAMVLEAMPSTTRVPVDRAVSILDGYSRFLARAAEANATYAVSVLSAGEVDGTIRDDGGLAAARAMAAQIGTPAASSDLPSALAQATNTMTYYVLTNGFVSGRQAYGLSNGPQGGGTIMSGPPAVMDAAVESAARSVEAEAKRLKANGVSVGFPLWDARWGAAAARANRVGPWAAAAGWVGLNDLWFDTVTMSMLTAAEESGLTAAEESGLTAAPRFTISP